MWFGEAHFQAGIDCGGSWYSNYHRALRDIILVVGKI